MWTQSLMLFTNCGTFYTFTQRQCKWNVFIPKSLPLWKQKKTHINHFSVELGALDHGELSRSKQWKTNTSVFSVKSIESEKGNLDLLFQKNSLPSRRPWGQVRLSNELCPFYWSSLDAGNFSLERKYVLILTENHTVVKIQSRDSWDIQVLHKGPPAGSSTIVARAVIRGKEGLFNN